MARAAGARATVFKYLEDYSAAAEEFRRAAALDPGLNAGEALRRVVARPCGPQTPPSGSHPRGCGGQHAEPARIMRADPDEGRLEAERCVYL